MAEDIGVLVEQVRHLADVQAAIDLDAAKEALNALVLTHGRVAVGAALRAVAPEEMAAATGGRHG